MPSALDTFGMVCDILAIVAAVGAVGTGIAWMFLALADGKWLPVAAIIDVEDGGTVARWFAADGGVGRATLSAPDAEQIGSKHKADVYYQQGYLDRARLDRRPAGWRVLRDATIGLAGLAVVVTIASFVLLIFR